MANTKETKRKSSNPAPGFAKLPLSDEMLEALDDAGYVDPTPIQEALIPLAIDGIDVLGQARTGTGKTASFVIPIIEELDLVTDSPRPQALILVPTRELSVQVKNEAVKLAKGLDVNCAAVYGGRPIRGQINELKRGVHIAVGTPGRVLDLLSRRVLLLNELNFVVLDEADRMLDIGFRPDIEKILRQCPQSRQTLLLSATVPPTIERLAKRYMHDPTIVDCSTTDLAAETIEQFYFSVHPKKKFQLLVALVEREKPRQAIVFCRTKRGTDTVHQRLSKKFKNMGCIHGDMAQRVRDRVMEKFRRGEVQILVATDIVGRGIDVSNISHIINYDIPQFCDDYVHRVGRTGRMGREGVAYSFVATDQGDELTRIEMRIDRLLKRDEMPGITDVDFETAPEQPQEKREVPDSLKRGGRSGKKYRRGL